MSFTTEKRPGGVMRYEDGTTPICERCAAIVARQPKNGELHEEWIARCLACGVEYCVEYSSEIDSRYCGNCMFDFFAETTIMSKTVTRKYPDTGEISSPPKRHECIHTVFHDEKHRFRIKKVRSMPYNEQLNMAKYHLWVYESIMKDMMEQQRLAYQQQQAQRAIHLNTPNAATITGKRSRVKTEKTKTKSVTRDQAVYILTQAFGRTPTQDELDQALGIRKEGDA